MTMQSAVSGSGLPVLIVDDELGAIEGSRFTLDSGGIKNTLGCQDAREVLGIVREREIGVILLDLFMPHVSGEELLATLNQEHPDVPVIIVTGANEMETAVRCMRMGASDYMVKPVEKNRLVSGVRRVLELREVTREYDRFKERVLRDELEHPEAFSEIVTVSPHMRTLFQYVETVAPTAKPVLVTGETGVGKELLARALHRLSGREGEFVPINVAGLDDAMFSDALFGHVKGAFTGADTVREGLVSRAVGGSLFLDEIGDLTVPSQTKLLRLVQENEYMPLGADVPRISQARVIVATNRNLHELRREGVFRSDLYYRLRTHHLHIPPLRERTEDIGLLTRHFIEQAADELGKPTPSPPPELFTLVKSYGFPGNVRELQAMVFDLVSQHKARMLSTQMVREYIQEHSGEAVDAPAVSDEGAPFAEWLTLPTVEAVRRMLIEEAMRRADGNQSVASRLIGMSQSGLSRALQRQDSD